MRKNKTAKKMETSKTKASRANNRLKLIVMSLKNFWKARKNKVVRMIPIKIKMMKNKMILTLMQWL